MADTLHPDIILLLREFGKIAQGLAMHAYAVGGFVRDLLLQTKNLDIDIVVEGDGIQFARELAAKKQATVRTHEKFATATVILADGMRIDVVTARLEYYAFPAALPTVEHSSLKQDLFRRDFTINAMAIRLNPARFGLLVDFLTHKMISKRVGSGCCTTSALLKIQPVFFERFALSSGLTLGSASILKS